MKTVHNVDIQKTNVKGNGEHC